MPAPVIVPQVPVRALITVPAKTIQLTDNNGIAGLYVSLYNLVNSDVNGVFKVTAPDGTVIYNNTSYASPDVNGSIAQWAKTISLPTNPDGTIVQGIYTVLYSVQIIDGTNPTYIVTNTSTYNFAYKSPVVSITQTVDCISPKYSIADLTNYAVSGVTPAITRTMTLDYPYGSAGAGSPLVTSAATLNTGTFYNGTQATTVSTILLYTFPSTGSSFTVYDLVTGVKEQLVDCTFICAISCCLQALEQRMCGYKGNNDVEYCRTKEKFEEAMSYVQLALISIACGNPNVVNEYICKIQKIADCTSGCDCGTGTNALVVGLGGSSVNVVVQGGGSPMVVTSSLVGGVTTYTLTLNSTFVNLVNNAYNSIVTNGDATISVVATGTNPITYAVKANLPAVQNKVELQVYMSCANPVANAASWTITKSSVVITGTKFQSPTIAVDSPSDPNWLNINNCFNVSNFFTGPPDTLYKVLAKLSIEGVAPASLKTFTVDLLSKIFGIQATAGTFYFQLEDLSQAYGFSVPANYLTAGLNIILTLVISE